MKSEWRIVSTERAPSQLNTRPLTEGEIETAVCVSTDAIGSENVTTTGSLGWTNAGATFVIVGAVESISNKPLSSQKVAPDRFVAVTFTITSRASITGAVQETCPSSVPPPGTVT